MKIKYKKLICYFLIILYIFSIFCNSSEEENKPIISEEEFINLYSEALILKNSGLRTEELDSAQIQIYYKYNLTKEKYDQIEKYYKINPDKWLTILDEVDNRIQKFADDQEEK